ncbi:MAG: hypothetical protein IJZ14_00335 [Oscillospiraceae bacterium]|nr:hypothetical protein [Oscillospiraceae bacterium]MBQ8748251.1 hypothetical protein [Oscillospiraceae bacterium]MBQ8881256.1 hypothetical protein [Oscillospiraceae bacterium]
MRNRIKKLAVLLLAALMLGGCTMRTVGQMYQLPRRSEDYSNLQSVMDKAMAGLKFSAPLSGDNQQSVQMADIDGDGEQEYMVFCKGTSELPLRILVFDRVNGAYVHIDSIESNGAAFDQVEYVQMDEKPGVEIVVGLKISDLLTRSVSVYTFAEGGAERLMTANYRKFLAVDMEGDGQSELFVLHSGQSETDPGVAELYSLNNGIIERSNEVSMSASVDKLKRILVGKLYDGKPAVFVASAVGDASLITDVYTVVDQHLANVVKTDPQGTGTQTLRNYYVYADDIDNDGVTEIPRLVTMTPLGDTPVTEPSKLILWYAVGSSGNTMDKLYTYYNATGGWYLKIDSKLAPRITVQLESNTFVFYLWDANCTKAEKLMTVYTLTGQNRDEQGLSDGRFVLLKTDTVVYSVALESIAADCGITQESLIGSFSLIHQDWNTGEM